MQPWNFMKLLFLFMTAAILAGCSHDKPDKPDVPSYMLYSPNGEPLNGGPLGKPSCKQAMEGWFERLSAGSGQITKQSFLADAEAQFLRMDIDHNGYLVSEELDRFREPYRPQPPVPKQGGDSSGETGRHKRGSKGSGTPSDPSLTMADPVMSADANLDFKVTPQEFMQLAQENFAKLDANHDNVLDSAEISKTCDQKH